MNISRTFLFINLFVINAFLLSVNIHADERRNPLTPKENYAPKLKESFSESKSPDSNLNTSSMGISIATVTQNKTAPTADKSPDSERNSSTKKVTVYKRFKDGEGKKKLK